MTATTAKTGKATLFKIGTAALAEVTKINGIGVELGTTDATHLGSGDYDDFIPTIMKNKDVTLEINFVPGGPDETALLAAMAEQAFKSYSIVYPSGATLAFTALMSSFDQGEITREGKMTASATFKPRGASTRA